MKLKDNIKFDELLKYGFVEDEANVEEGDHFYGTNNYYYKFKNSYGAEFRLVVNIHSREVEILALARETGLLQLCDLDIFVELIKKGVVE